jgi:hypothetical protein
MEPGKYTLKIRRGATLRKTLTLTTSAGTAFDLTGYTATAEIKAAIGGEVVDSLTCTIDDDPETGVITIELDAAATAALSGDDLIWDLVIEAVDGWRGYLLEGPVTVRGSVTEDAPEV